MSNLFKEASIQQLRFASVKGELTTEQLWTLPLESKNGFDLDAVARHIHQQIKLLDETSFVATAKGPAKEAATLTLKLEIVKEIIADKLAYADKLRTVVANNQERQKLLEILHNKKADELQGLSVEEIERRIAALS